MEFLFGGMNWLLRTVPHRMAEVGTATLASVGGWSQESGRQQ